jgi:hypothetical protein
MMPQAVLIALLLASPGGWAASSQAQRVAPGDQQAEGVVAAPAPPTALCGRRRKRGHRKCGPRQTAERHRTRTENNSAATGASPANTNVPPPTGQKRRRYNPELQPPEKSPTPGVRPPSRPQRSSRS